MFRTWIGASAADALVRLAAQMIGTIIVARILTPVEFGISTLVLAVTTVLGAFIGLPFEEALSQRRRLHGAHLETVLFASFVPCCVAVALAVVLGPMIERWSNAPGLAQYLLFGTLLLLWQAPGAITKAMARRSRRFVEIAFCQAMSTVIATLASVLAALAGWGVYSLLLQRLLPNAIYPMLTIAILALRGQRVWIPMRWHGDRLRDIFRFSWLRLADVGVTSASPAVLAFMVNAYFGGAVLGQLNVALRIVDPLRMAILGGGHNLAFSVLVRLQLEPARLIAKAGQISAGVAMLAVAAFVGLAASAPILLPLLVGPGWEQAVSLSQILCLAVAISMPFRFYYTGFSALGRPEYGLIGSFAGLLCMLAGFLALAPVLGSFTPAAAFLLYEVVTVAVALILACRIDRAAACSSGMVMVRVWLAAIAMAGAVVGLQLWLAPLAVSVPNLVMLILVGALSYSAALTVTCRPCMRGLLAMVKTRRG